MITIKFTKKLELYEGTQLHYLAECSSKKESILIKKAWKLRGDTSVRIKRYKNLVRRNSKHLACYKLYKNDILVNTLYLPHTVGYYLKVYWLTIEKEKIIEIEYVHHRWPKDYFEKKVVISTPAKVIKGL